MHTNINIKNLIITTIIEVINFDVSEAVVCMLWPMGASERACAHARTFADITYINRKTCDTSMVSGRLALSIGQKRKLVRVTRTFDASCRT